MVVSWVLSLVVCSVGMMVLKEKTLADHSVEKWERKLAEQMVVLLGTKRAGYLAA